MTAFQSVLKHEHISFGYRSDNPVKAVFHSHAEYEIYYFHEGSCRYLIGDQIYELEPGDLIIMHGMTLHCANMSPGKPYVRSICHFDPVYVQEMMMIPGRIDVTEPFRRLQNARLQLEGTGREAAEELLLKMNASNRPHDPASYFRFHLQFYELLVLIYTECKQLSRPAPAHTSEKLEHVQRIISFIEAHYMEDIHLSDMEEALHLNRQYLSKLFKEVTGTTIFTYLFERRINQSRILITMNPEMKLTDISYQIGFKHPAHFSRVFKQYIGVSPDQYRRTSDFNIALT
ncbi:AraC family transcriptional regulator [Paenibacillus pinihumi]|uniref:AraC family transcriptional regulator n=1 Tax=Paenibacillus pinihumi TaxID=669462 RepID=UPI000419559D|nr:helix-turn-helix domain-containing protein [Paenibacillus pinihumi]